MLTEIQRTALSEMDKRNLVAIAVTGYGFVFPEHIRRDEKVAQAVLSQITTSELNKLLAKLRDLA